VPTETAPAPEPTETETAPAPEPTDGDDADEAGEDQSNEHEKSSEHGNSAWAHQNAAAHRAAGLAKAAEHRNEHAATPAVPSYGSGSVTAAVRAPGHAEAPKAAHAKPSGSGKHHK
jgi:hypothetical protein